MNDFLSMIFVSGDLLQTMCRMMILFISFDCLITFGGLIKSIKGAVS